MTINFELDDVEPHYTIHDLLYQYWLNVISTNSSYSWEYCYPKMMLVRRTNGELRDQSLTIAQYNIYDGEALTVVCDFSY